MRNQSGAVDFVGSFPGKLPDLGLPEVAFAGRSNVGKSSALNRLLGTKKAARVSSRPGRTQSINLFKIGNACVFADLPGYGFAKVPEAIRAEWRGMLEKYFQLREPLKLVVLLVDIRRDAQELDAMLIDGMVEMELPVLVLATKVDKLTRNERLTRLRDLEEGLELPPDVLIPFSSVTGEGVDEVWDRIGEICGTKG